MSDSRDAVNVISENGASHASGPKPKQFTSQFAETALVEFLDRDQRPTFVLDFRVTIDNSDNSATLDFCNVALKGRTGLRQIVERSFPERYARRTRDDEDIFRNWVRSQLSPSTPRRAKVFFDTLWSVTSTPDGWAVVSGVELSQCDFSSFNTVDDSESGSQKHDVAMQDVSSRASLSSTDTDSKFSRGSKRSRTLLGEMWPPNQLPTSSHVAWIREFDWASTALGPIVNWSPQLREIVELCLANPDPATVFWGSELILIYNEAYIALAGNKHPQMIGGSARMHWKEVWDAYDLLFDQMRTDGKAFKQMNSQLFTYRRGYLEEGFYNLVVMPVLGEDGSVQGFYEPVFEVTKQTLSERRMNTLLQLSECTSSATTLKDLWRLLLGALSGHESDIYFAVLYSLQHETLPALHPQYNLEGAVGFRDKETNSFLSSLSLHEAEQEGLVPALISALEFGTPVLLKESDQSLAPSMLRQLKSAGIAEAPREVVVYPLSSSVDNHIEAFLIIGINPKRPYDDDYTLFINLLARQIESTITFVKLFEKERDRLRQQAVFESELKFKQFAENAPVGIFNFDPAGNVRFCNEAWLELSGHDRNDMSTMSWVDDIHPENVSEIKQYWDKISNLEGPQTFEVQYKKPWTMDRGGEIISLDRTFVVASGYAEKSEDGKLAGILGCITDISSLKWVDQVQSRKLAEALELKRQQENFLDITSHEMRNPLNAILHCAAELNELLSELTISVPTDERISVLKNCLDASRTITYCGKHQKRIIDDVLTLSKLDSNLLSIFPEDTIPLDVVEEVLKVYDTELRASSIQTNIELADSFRESDVHMLLVDPHRVIQILINLVANAIKFTKVEPVRRLNIVIMVGIGMIPQNRQKWGQGQTIFLHFSVQDTGPGMSQEEANQLFNRFAQGSPRTHVQYGGSGLGLFISRELAELHGGCIGISSELGAGSTFDFYVKGRRSTARHTRQSSGLGTESNSRRPVPNRRISGGPPPALSHASKSSPSVLKRASPPPICHILIVEDNLINQKILSKLMRKQGYAVSIANHGEEALSIILASTWHLNTPASHTSRTHTLDIVLADIEMPIMDGKAFIEKVREWQEQGKLKNDIPVIAVTGNARSEQIEQAKECGFDDVVSKPYKVEDLVSRIQEYTGTRT